MIDTIVLTLEASSMFAILDPTRFEPSASFILDRTQTLGGRGYATAKQNPTPAELRNGIYKPYLTLTRRFKDGRSVAMLKIQFSIPKLMFGNNFDELQDGDYDKVFERLSERLNDMGIRMWNMPDTLHNAQVSAIHYSKNIVLTDGSTPKQYIDKLRAGNHSMRLDTNQTDYRNEGTSWKLHTNTYEIAYYDKVADLRQARISDKRAIEQDNSIQLNLFDQIKKLPSRTPFEVLRMEVRLNRRQTIKATLKRLEIDEPVTLRGLFHQEIAKKVLLSYLDLSTAQPALLSYQPTSEIDLLSELRVKNPTLSPGKLLALYGLKEAVDKVGIRDLRQILGSNNRASWYKLIKEAKSVVLAPSSDPFGPVRSQITNYHPLKLLDYREIMINNDKRIIL